MFERMSTCVNAVSMRARMRVYVCVNACMHACMHVFTSVCLSVVLYVCMQVVVGQGEARMYDAAQHSQHDKLVFDEMRKQFPQKQQLNQLLLDARKQHADMLATRAAAARQMTEARFLFDRFLCVSGCVRACRCCAMHWRIVIHTHEQTRRTFDRYCVPTWS